MKKKNNKITIGLVVLLILFLGAFWAFNHLFYGVAGVVFSCSEESFKGFSYTHMPPACMGCIPDCKSNMSIFDSENNLICNNWAEDYGETVLVPCKNLEDYGEQVVKIQYSIQNGETKTTEVQYNK